MIEPSKHKKFHLIKNILVYPNIKSLFVDKKIEWFERFHKKKKCFGEKKSIKEKANPPN